MLTETPAKPRHLFRHWRWLVTGHGRVWVLAVIGLLLAGGTVARVKYPRSVPKPVPPRYPMTTAVMRPPGHLRVLFLGNSLTEYNGGLAYVMEQLAMSANPKPVPIFDEVSKYGATWAQLWDATKAREVIDQGNWDYVVLQDYSTAPMSYRSEMDVYGQRFSREIEKVGAKPVFFMTWPHNDQLPLSQRIAGAYISLALENQGLVAPVGYAWKRVMKDYPQLELYDSRDKPRKHPTPAGTYLTACVFYSMFFNQSPHGLTGRIVEGTNVYIDLDPLTAEDLQDAAWETVKEMGELATTQPIVK